MHNGLLVVQAALVAISASAAWLYRGQAGAVAALYGGAIAIGSAWMLMQRVRRAGELVKRNPQRGAYSLYFGAIQRFVFVLLGLGVGMGTLELAPVPLLVGFAVAQFAYAIAAGREALK